MDLIFDSQVLRHRGADELPEPVLASIAGYYHRADDDVAADELPHRAGDGDPVGRRWVFGGSVAVTRGLAARCVGRTGRRPDPAGD